MRKNSPLTGSSETKRQQQPVSHIGQEEELFQWRTEACPIGESPLPLKLLVHPRQLGDNVWVVVRHVTESREDPVRIVLPSLLDEPSRWFRSPKWQASLRSYQVWIVGGKGEAHIIAGKIKAKESGICHCASLVLLTLMVVP